MDKPATFDSLVGRVLDGRYLVGERIARGGMATVYEATDLRLDRVVALKVLPQALSDDAEFPRRFAREARSAACLTHPNVVAVYDHSEDDGVLFLVMEYVAGRHTLRDVIRTQAPLSPMRALSLLEEVLKAISAAHHSGIVHRDIKPENVLIDPLGQVKVADFGLARAISSATSATATSGVLLGTVSYLPPELVTIGTADARSDVYSLGVMAFELLTGCKPHTGESPIHVAYKHVHEDVCPPSELVEGIPPYLDAFVARATRRDRDQRPADAQVMLHQLRRVRHALDAGVIDDQELTDDLTPTVSIGLLSGVTLADAIPPSGRSNRPAPYPSVSRSRVVDPDEVFDFTAYDDFATRHPDPATGAAAPERTLLVGETRRLTHPAENLPRESAAPGGATPRSGSTTTYHHHPDAHVPSRVMPRRKKGGWFALFLVLLLAAAAGAAGWYYGVGRFEATPNVVSLSESAARRQVGAAGLSFQVASTAYSETVRPGHVISTDPEKGQQILSAGTVMAVLSRGPERHDMPDLTTMTEAEAIDTVSGSSLRVAKIDRVWSEDVANGDVVSFTPRAGVELEPAAKVSLVVSRGPEPIKILDFRGEDGVGAEQSFQALGLEVELDERYHDQVAEGDVIRQTPPDGTLFAGDSVRLVLSLGPHLVEVPSVYNFGTEAAIAELEDLGFDVETEQFDPYFGLGFVVGQSAGAGELAPWGSTITLTVV